jgi:DNA helicase-2/ATP-dependent DNA helicase PcrA
LEEEVLQTTPNAIRLLTAHKAKGLEFEQVFIMHAVDKHWGNVPSRTVLSLPSGILRNDLAADPTHNEDERRLFYVAITRAKQQLYITSYTASNSGRTQVPSVFVSELTSDCVTTIDTTASDAEALEHLQTILLQTPPMSHTDAERIYLQAKLATYSLSPSHLNDYLTCPKLFYYQDVLRVPQPTARAVGYGTAVHSALELTVGEYLRTKQLPSVEFLLEKFEQHLAKQTLSTKDMQDSLRFGQAELTSYYAAHQARLATPAMVENKFVAEIHGVPINGKIDKIEFTGDNKEQAHVVDYKTGNPDNKSAKLAKGGDYHRQLLFYKLLCNQSPQFKRTVVSGEIHFIQASKKTKIYPHKQYELTNDDVAELSETIKRVYTEIQALKFLDASADDCCGDCRFCELFG